MITKPQLLVFVFFIVWSLLARNGFVCHLKHNSHRKLQDLKGKNSIQQSIRLELRQEIRRSRGTSQKPVYHEDIPIPFSLSLVNKTFLKGKELKCCYKASIDGFSATNFHERCDFKGPCVIIAYTKEKTFKFGGFSPEGYKSTDDYYDTFDAFLFYWLDDCDEPIILPKVGGSGAALFDYARGGPQFGADGLLIGPPLAPVMGGFAGPDTNSGIGDLRMAKSRLGLSYAKRKDGKESLFGDESKVTLDDVLVFCNPYIASLY